MNLSAKKRDVFGKKTNSLRKSGSVPAVLYGAGIGSMSVSLDLREFEKVYKEAGESSVVEFSVEGEKDPFHVLIQEVYFHPVNGKIMHVDLHKVSMDEKIKAFVPLEFFGESLAVKNLGGVLVKNIHEIEIESLPGDLPSEIKVDISALNTFDDVVSIKNINLPKGVKISANLEDVVVLAVPPREEEAAEKSADVSAVKVETEEKKKEREEKEELEGEKK